MRSIIFLLLILCQFNLTSQEVFTVTARSGLSLRAEAALAAERVGGIPFNAQVEIRGPFDQDYKAETIDGVDGEWWPVRYGQQEGYAFSAYLRSGELFVPGRAGVNEDFRIAVPGVRFEPINYDAELNLYALTADFRAETEPELLLQKAEPQLQIGLEVSSEISGYSNEPNLVYLDAEIPNGRVALLLIGTREPLPQLLDMEQRTYRNCDGIGELWGQTIFPFQQLSICWAANGSHYGLGGRSIYNPEISQAPIYELCLLENGSYYFSEDNVVQSISDELLEANVMFDGKPYRPAFYDHPQLAWTGDLNGDHLPDMVFYQPNNPEACGGAERYILLVSDIKAGQPRWHKVSSDTMHFEGC